MKLYLSSYRIPVPDELASLLAKPLSETSVVLIPNAKDYYSERARDFKIAGLVTYMEQLGLGVDIVDLRGYTDPADLKKKLAGYNLIWVMGGNTFYLNYFIHKSGLSDVIRGFLDSGMVYGGESAGAVVAGSTLKGIDQVDDPKEAPGIVWEGLGLMDKGIIPHWGWEKYATEIKAARDVMAETTEVITIDNDHAVIIENSNERVIENPAAL